MSGLRGLVAPISIELMWHSGQPPARESCLSRQKWRSLQQGGLDLRLRDPHAGPVHVQMLLAFRDDVVDRVMG